MEFLKKHYEKIILAAFLLVFIVSLILLILSLSKSMDIKEEDLKFPVKAPDYKKVSPEDINYKKNLDSEKKWLEGAPRTEGDKDFTDLLAPFKIARCPSPDCQKLIPQSCFVEGGTCPFCKFALHAIGSSVPTGKLDDDADGIPNEIELEAGLDPKNPDDVNKTDASGFTYLEKFKAGCVLKDPKSHPPYAKKVKLYGIKRNLLPIVLVKVTAHGEDEKTWTIQMDEAIGGAIKTRFYKVGAILNLNDRKYVIKDIKSEVKEESVDKKGSYMIKKTVYSIILQEDGGAPITAVEKQKVWETRETARIVLESANREICKELTVAANETFTLGDAKAGEEKYLVKSVNSEKGRIVIVRASDNAEFEIVLSEEPSKETAPAADRIPMMQPAMPAGIPQEMRPGMPPAEPRNN